MSTLHTQAGAGSHGSSSALRGRAYNPAAETDNTHLSHYLYLICGCVAICVIIWRATDRITKYIRTVVCAGSEKQRYFANPSPNLSFIKKQILYAPVISKRHNREIQLSSAVNVGTLPTRFQLLFLVAYFATNVAFCLVNIPFGSESGDVADLLRNRTGVLSVVNMIPLFVLAGRNNPLIPILGISFDTYNLIHRWFGRIVVLEALAHTLAFMAKSGWGDAFSSIFATPFLRWGFIGTVAVLALSIQAYSPIRHAFYEVFKLLHIAIAALAVVGIWYHLHLKSLPQLPYLYTAVGLWVAERFLRYARLVWHNFGGSRTRTTVEALPGNACRVTITLARPWRSRPGQHAYLYMPAVSLLQSHPFSVAWNDSTDDLTADRIATTRQELEALKKTKISFIIRARTGFTDSLYQRAANSPSGKFSTSCFVEGPYGTKHPLNSYGSVVLFAGGVGITHQVPYVRELVNGYGQETVATRKILLVWVLQSPEHLEWIRPWMTEILALERRREVLRILLFISQPRSSKEIHSPSATVQMFPGRPNIDTLLGMEQEQQVGAMAVSVCGPGSFSDEVRLAVRRRQQRTTVDFIEEAFSW